jgi:nucleoside-diphosphate-sugar epimerase
LDIQPIPHELTPYVIPLQGDILDKAMLSRLVSEYEIDTIYHLAALLSTRSEFTPAAAHTVNVQDNWLFPISTEQSERENR